MRRKILVLTVVVAAIVLAAVTAWSPILPPVLGALAISILVIAFAACWPMVVSDVPRWGVSLGLAVTGLLSVWVLTLLPAGTTFAETARDLWLAPVGGAAAFGVLVMFVIQTFTLPGGLRRGITTAVLAFGAVIAASAAGWTLLFRHKAEVDAATHGVQQITGMTSMLLTTLLALAVAAGMTLIPVRRRTRMLLAVGAAILVATVAQLAYGGALLVAAIIAATLAGVLIALTDAYSTTREVPPATLRHPLTAVAMGSGVTIATGMVSYFVVHAIAW